MSPQKILRYAQNDRELKVKMTRGCSELQYRFRIS